MASHLVPCPGCSRHVRAREDACPFCRTALPDAVRASAPPRRVVARLSRAGLIAASAAAAAIAATACGGEETGPSEPMVQTDYGIAIGDYDAAPDGADAADAAPTDDASDSSFPMVDAVYGGPPLDAGSDVDGGD
jgi:hypothetical protein